MKLQTLSSWFAFLPFLILIVRQFKLRKDFFPLSLYIVLASVTEVLNLTANGVNIHYINSFAILSFPLIGWIFIRLINNKGINKLIFLISLALFCFGIINMIFFQGLYFINSYTFMIQVVFVTLLSSVLIYQCYNSIQAGQNPAREPKLLTALAFLFYYGTSFFVFAYAFEALRFKSDFPIDVWLIHSVFNILFNCLLAYIVLISKKSTTLAQ